MFCDYYNNSITSNSLLQYFYRPSKKYSEKQNYDIKYLYFCHQKSTNSKPLKTTVVVYLIVIFIYFNSNENRNVFK